MAGSCMEMAHVVAREDPAVIVRETEDTAPPLEDDTKDADGIYAYVDGELEGALRRMEEQRDAVWGRAMAELERATGLAGRKHCFNEPFTIRNHMVRCFFCGKDDDLVVTGVEEEGEEDEIDEYYKNMFDRDAGNNLKELAIHPPKGFSLPLFELRNEIPLSFFSPWDFPAMVIFSDRYACTALLSCGGKMVVTGGYNLQQVKNSTVHFARLIIGAMRRVFKREVRLAHVNLRNRFSSNKVGANLIDVPGVVNHARRNGWLTRYREIQINIASIKPFPDTLPSLTVCLIPKGGVNVMGFTAQYEVELMFIFLEQFLWRFLRRNPKFKGWERYTAARKTKERGRYKDAIRQRLRKIKEWRCKVEANTEAGAYAQWPLTADDTAARKQLRADARARGKQVVKDLRRPAAKKKLTLVTETRAKKRKRAQSDALPSSSVAASSSCSS